MHLQAAIRYIKIDRQLCTVEGRNRHVPFPLTSPWVWSPALSTASITPRSRLRVCFDVGTVTSEKTEHSQRNACSAVTLSPAPVHRWH